MAPDNFEFKSIRDPIYGFIGISRTELAIINTDAFRRLHGIKQLSHSYLVYPTAVHTRYEHSLGAMHMAGRMCDKLKLSDEDKRLARLAALLHDIGHGPFSHTFELILEKINRDIKNKIQNTNKIHEHIGLMIIKDDPQISKCLGRGTKRAIIDILKGPSEMKYPLLSDIVSGNLDADKLDYFARDSYNLGVKYGVVDTERILHILRKNKGNTRIGIDKKGIYMIDSYRMARHMIATQIYTHHVRIAADRMFYHAVFAAFDEDVLDKNDFKITSSSFREFYTTLDDYSFVNKILSNADRDSAPYEILSNIKKRKLLKRCYVRVIDNVEKTRKANKLRDPSTILPKVAQIGNDLGLRKDELIFYESNLPITLFGESVFPIIDARGHMSEHPPLSPIWADASVISHYVFGRADMRSKIKQRLRQEGIFSR